VPDEDIATPQVAEIDPVDETPKPITPESIPPASTAAAPIVATASSTEVAAPVATETAPAAAPTGSSPDTEKFAALLAAASQRMDNGQLIEPTDDSARFFLSELEAIQPDSAKTQQTRMRLANLMLLEAMVAINGDDFSGAANWITQAHELDVPDSMIARYETELAEALEAKSARDAESLGAIFASATPAAILANPDFKFDAAPNVAGGTAATSVASQPTALAMVLPGATPSATGAQVELPAAEPEPQLTPLSELKFRRFVKPEPPPRSVTRGTTGWVEVQFSVNKKGRTEEIRVMDSEPGEMFDRVALEAVRKWRFRPYIVDGKKTPTQTGVRLKFEGE
jgi:TonB family protein